MIRPRNSEESVKQLFEIFAEHELPIYPETMVLVEEIFRLVNKKNKKNYF